MTNIKIGVIGLGSISDVHIKAIQQNSKQFELVATADPFVSNQDDHLKHYSDYKELLKDDGIQAVSIVTPPATHYEIATDCLRAGKAVLLEKPPTLSIVECLELAETTKATGQVIYMTFHARYRPEVEKAKKLLNDKDIVGIEIIYKEDVLYYHSPDGWIFDPAIGGGGVLIDSGINALSIVNHVLPGLKYKITKSQLHIPQDFRVETRAEVDFICSGTIKGLLSMDWMYQDAETRKIIFRTANSDTYTIDIVNGLLQKNDQAILGSGSSSHKVDLQSEYNAVYADFAKYLEKRESLMSIEEMSFVLQAYDWN